LVAALFAAFAEWLSQLFFSAALVGRCFSAAACSRFIGRFRWLLSPAVAVGRFHWPLSLAAFIGRFHWPLSLATSLSRSLPARRPRQCGGIPFAYLLATPPCGDNTFAEERKEHGTCIHRQQRSAGKAGPPAWAAFPQNQRGR